MRQKYFREQALLFRIIKRQYGIIIPYKLGKGYYWKKKRLSLLFKELLRREACLLFEIGVEHRFRIKAAFVG